MKIKNKKENKGEVRSSNEMTGEESPVNVPSVLCVPE